MDLSPVHKRKGKRREQSEPLFNHNANNILDQSNVSSQLSQSLRSVQKSNADSPKVSCSDPNKKGEKISEKTQQVLAQNLKEEEQEETPESQSTEFGQVVQSEEEEGSEIASKSNSHRMSSQSSSKVEKVSVLRQQHLSSNQNTKLKEHLAKNLA